jgi:hypothetical protein
VGHRPRPESRTGRTHPDRSPSPVRSVDGEERSPTGLDRPRHGITASLVVVADAVVVASGPALFTNASLSLAPCAVNHRSPPRSSKADRACAAARPPPRTRPRGRPPQRLPPFASREGALFVRNGARPKAAVLADLAGYGADPVSGTDCNACGRRSKKCASGALGCLGWARR